MKYVIFKYKKNLIMPVIIPDHVTHSQVILEDCVAVSAGFFKLNGSSIETYGDSESLQLKPKNTDAHYLTEVLLNSGTYAFLDSEYVN